MTRLEGLKVYYVMIRRFVSWFDKGDNDHAAEVVWSSCLRWETAVLLRVMHCLGLKVVGLTRVMHCLGLKVVGLTRVIKHLGRLPKDCSVHTGLINLSRCKLFVPFDA
jgi:hypothetical protein